MANQIVFTTDPDSMGPLNQDKLCRLCLPYYARRKAAQKEAAWGRKFNTFYDSDDEEYWRQYHQPLIYWITKLIQDIERDVNFFPDVLSLSWEFANYVHRRSIMMWFITIRDSDGEIVHKNWSIGIGEEGDLYLKRGKATNDSPMSDGYSFLHEDTYQRLCDVLRTHMQLRNWAQNKNKTS